MSRTPAEIIADLKARITADRKSGTLPLETQPGTPPSIRDLERSIQVYDYGIHDILEGAEAGNLTPKDAETIAYFEEMIAGLKEAVAKMNAEAGGSPET